FLFLFSRHAFGYLPEHRHRLFNRFCRRNMLFLIRGRGPLDHLGHLFVPYLSEFLGRKRSCLPRIFPTLALGRWNGSRVFFLRLGSRWRFPGVETLPTPRGLLRFSLRRGNLVVAVNLNSLLYVCIRK